MNGMRMSGYGQFCPVAKAAELLDQRWTILVIRELVAGSNRFNDLHRGVPRMSRTLLSTRLRQLVDADIVERHVAHGSPVYELTAAGRDLEQVIEALGAWGVRHLSSLTEDDLDPALLLRDMHRRVDTDALPPGRTVCQLRFRDLPAGPRRWWLLLTAGEVDLCDRDPGVHTDVRVDTGLHAWTRVWRGDLSLNEAVRGGSVTLRGPRKLRRQVPKWFRLGYFADVPRPA